MRADQIRITSGNIFRVPIGFLTVRQMLVVFGTYWLGGAAIVAIASTLLGTPGWLFPVDSTDLDAAHRSGVRIVTDYGTGREYLVTPQGGITPRLSAVKP